MPQRIDENTNRHKPFGEVGTVRENIKETRFGQKVFVTPMPGYSLDCYNPDIANRAMSRPRMLFPQSLLRVTEHDLKELSYLPGAWALTIDGRPAVANGQPVISPDYPGDFPVSPLMAQVTFGTGAAAHTVELDAIRNTILLPSLDVNVDVGVSQVVGLQAIAQTYGLFSRYEVRGVIHRVGAGASFSRATRSYICGSYYPTLPIPNFANSFCYASFQPLAFQEQIAIDPITEWWSDNDAAASGVAESFTADILSQNSRMHCFRDYHPLAKSITLPTLVDGAGPGTAYPGTMINQLDF